MKKILLTIPLILVTLLSFTTPLHADLIIPYHFDIPDGKCTLGQVEYPTFWSNTQFQSERDCLTLTDPSDLTAYIFAYILPILIITILLELPIYLLFFGKKYKSIKPLIYTNIITVPIFQLVSSQIIILLQLPVLTSSINNFYIITLLEILVVIGEIALIRKWIKDVRPRKIFRYSLLANSISALIGLLLLSIL